MEDTKKLELDVRKYLRIRKIFRTIELILLVVLLYFKLTDNVGNLEFFCFLFATFVIPESTLAIMRSNLKLGINNEILVAENEMEIYEQLCWEEKDIELLIVLKSKIDETKRKIETLESIKKRLVLFSSLFYKNFFWYYYELLILWLNA